MKQQSKKQIEEGTVVILVLTFIFIVTDLESNPVKSPRSPHSLPNRGGLANHVLQGSLRLTASRHHILANSGMEIDLNKRRELNQGLPQTFHSQDDDTFDDNNMLLKHSVPPRRRARRPTEKGINMVNRKRAASDVQSETVSQKKQKGILKSTEKKILKRAKKIKLKKNKRTTRSSNRRTTLVIENKQETVKEAEVVQSPVSLKSPVSIKSPTTSSEEGTSRRLRGRPPKNVLEPEPQPNPADNYMSSEVVETAAVPSGASETDLTARTALPRTRGEKRQRSLSLSAVAKPRRKRKPQMEQWDRQLFGRRRRTQSLSTDVDKKTGLVDTELLTKGSHDLRNKTTQLHSTSNGIVSVRPSLSDFKQLDEHNPLADKVLTECLTNGTSSLKGATKVNKKKSIECDYVPQFFDVVWAKCKGFKPYPALVRLLLILWFFN